MDKIRIAYVYIVTMLGFELVILNTDFKKNI